MTCAWRASAVHVQGATNVIKFEKSRLFLHEPGLVVLSVPSRVKVPFPPSHHPSRLNHNNTCCGATSNPGREERRLLVLASPDGESGGPCVTSTYPHRNLNSPQLWPSSTRQSSFLPTPPPPRRLDRAPAKQDKTSSSVPTPHASDQQQACLEADCHCLPWRPGAAASYHAHRFASTSTQLPRLLGSSPWPWPTPAVRSSRATAPPTLPMASRVERPLAQERPSSNPVASWSGLSVWQQGS